MTDLLMWTAETYDVSLNWRALAVECLALSVVFLEPMCDALINMVGKKTDGTSIFDLWSAR